MTNEEVLQIVQEAFAMPRPERFTDHPGCRECAEHEETLQAHTLESLSCRAVNQPAWAPITMCQPEAFAYWMPALARICLEGEDPECGWYGELLFTSDLRRDGPGNERWAHCTPSQRAAIARFVEHVIDTQAGLLASYNLEHEALDVLAIWSDQGDGIPA